MEKCSLLDNLRKYKILDMSIFDWVAALIAGWAIAHFSYSRVCTNMQYSHYVIGIEVLVILAGILVHKLMKVDTILGYYLGLNPKPIRSMCV